MIGHSFGGLIVEKLLGDGHAAAGVAIDAAPIKGVLPVPISALRVAFAALKNPGNIDEAVSLTLEQFHYGFGNALIEEESAELFERGRSPPGPAAVPGRQRHFNPHAETKVDVDNKDRGPLLLTAGGQGPHGPEGNHHADAQAIPQVDRRDRPRASSTTAATRSASTADGATSPTRASTG